MRGSESVVDSCQRTLRPISTVNRSTAIDSVKSLDRIRRPGDLLRMDETRSSHFERRDAARNMKRFYRLTITRDLFGTVLLIREWGRIGVSCQRRCEEKTDAAEALRAAARLTAQKLRRGYAPVAG